MGIEHFSLNQEDENNNSHNSSERAKLRVSSTGAGYTARHGVAGAGMQFC